DRWPQGGERLGPKVTLPLACDLCTPSICHSPSTMAKKYWPKDDPIGKRITIGKVLALNLKNPRNCRYRRQRSRERIEQSRTSRNRAGCSCVSTSRALLLSAGSGRWRFRTRAGT